MQAAALLTCGLFLYIGMQVHQPAAAQLHPGQQHCNCCFLSTGAPVAQQLRQAPIPVAVSMIVITLATLVPILKGEPQGGKGGVFSSRAEK